MSNWDVVKEPQHYKHGTFEVIDEMILVFGPQRAFDFCIMNAWKYRARAPYKGKFEEDMAKANTYLKMAKDIADRNGNIVNLIKVNNLEELQEYV